MKQILVGLFLLCDLLCCFAQSADLPTDFLPNDFHLDRRSQLRQKLPPNSVAVFFANAVRNRSNDVDYEFHQDPDFYYLTGYKEPQSILLIFKDKQTAANGNQYDEILFVQPRNERAEMWTGRRLGDAGVKSQLGFNFTNKEFKRYSLDFSRFDKVLFFDFQNDVRDDPRDSSDLADLISQLKMKVHYPEKGQLAIRKEPVKSNLDVQSLQELMDHYVLESTDGIYTK